MKQDYTKGNIWLSVKQMMNSDYRVIHSGDSLRRVIEIYKETKLDSVPVVDDKGVLLGVMPRSRLYQALLDGVSIDEPCTPYMVSPAFSVDSDLGYDEVSLIVRVNKSTIGTVPVVDKQGKVIGMAGRVEYMKAGFHVATTTSALLESIFEAMHEGIIATDNEGCIIRINHSIEKMFGISAEEVVGLHLEEVFPGIDHSNDFKLGVKNTLRGIPVIINQVPIMRDDKQIGTNFVLLDISDIENIARNLGSEMEQDIIKEVYEKLPKISIDYGIMEKCNQVLVIPAFFAWDDVGSWAALERYRQADPRGNILESKGVFVDTSQCMVYSPKRVVATLGVEGLIIVDNQDSLLVCSKDRAQEIKQVVEALKVAGYQDLI